MKTHVVFFLFHFMLLYFFSNAWPWSMSIHNVLLGRIFHKTAHYTDSAIACPTAGNVNYCPQQNIVRYRPEQARTFIREKKWCTCKNAE